MNKTLSFYEEHATSFYETTILVDFHDIQDIFLNLLKKESSILDFGCGSGRDTKYFLEHGYSVTALDGCKALCELASNHTGIPVMHMKFENFQEENKYDGIWACASILHLPTNELKQVLKKLYLALKEHGILYTSFKYGELEGERNGRYFNDMTKEKFNTIIKELKIFQIEDYFITGDARIGREDEKWLNIILRK